MRLDATNSKSPSEGWLNHNEVTSVRYVRLVRRQGASFGFHLRGGREHGTGFFISHVEPDSEAYEQGLRVRFLKMSYLNTNLKFLR